MWRRAVGRKTEATAPTTLHGLLMTGALACILSGQSQSVPGRYHPGGFDH
jgi:hypothetical protein